MLLFYNYTEGLYSEIATEGRAEIEMEMLENSEQKSMYFPLPQSVE